MTLIDRLYKINEGIDNDYITYCYWGICNIILWFWGLFTKCKLSDKSEREERIIVSLTSFPKRIKYVWLPIRSLLCNTQRPDRLILWLSKEQFPKGENSLPRLLLNLKKYGAEFRFVEGDIKSHKKYYYAYREFKDDLVLLVDDDLIYPSYFISKMYEKWKISDKPSMVFNYGQRLYSAQGELLPADQRVDVLDEDNDSRTIMAGSGGGLMLRPSTLSPLITNKDLFLSLTPYSDDYWIDTNVRYSGLKMYKTRGGKLLQLYIYKDFRLWTINRVDGEDYLKRLNDYMINNYNFEPYPQNK